MANSKQQLLEWLSLKPRTAGWGAIVAYNKNKCNALLLQDYIKKFTTDSYLPPINKPVGTGNANWEYLSDWLTDAPRASFENSSRAVGGQVNLKVAVVGGTQISIDNALGYKRAIAIKSIDALDHPELIAENVLLSKTRGTVGKDTGEVVLDLGDEASQEGLWELTFANTQHERQVGGKFFKKYFKEADKAKRLYHLGKIAYTDQQFLKPASFRVRTITAPGASVRTAKNYEDGEVQLQICMQDDEEGGDPPTDDWGKLVPDGETEEYDCTVLFNNKIVMQKGIYPGALLPGEDVDIRLHEVIDGSGLIVGYTVDDWLNDVLRLSMDKFTVGNQTVDPYHGVWMQLGAGKYKVDLVRNGPNFGNISVSWDDDFEAIPLGINDEIDKFSSVNFERKLLAYYQYQIEPVTGAATFVLLDSSVVANFKDETLSRWFNAAEIEIILENLSSQVVSRLKKILQHIADSARSLDVFVTKSLLFLDNNTVCLQDGSMPADLVFFGKFTNPFSVAPVEHLMGHSATHTFSVSKDYTGTVEWSISPVTGSDGPVGQIDKARGHYIAPDISDIPGTLVRVIVTATDPVSKFSSSGLITVVTRDITVNPVVQICNASSDDGIIERTLSANSLGEGRLDWKVTRGTGSIPLNGTDGKNTFTAGWKDNELAGAFTVDEIEVKNLATNKTQTAYVVVNHFSNALKVTIDMTQSSFPDGKAKFKAINGRDKEVAAIWEVAAGSGEIDSNGFYRADPAGQHRFALVTAHVEDANGDISNGWCIAPLPLVELPDKPPDDFLAD